LVTSVEVFEVLKLGFGTDFQLLSAHPESTNVPTGYKKPLSQDILEWRPNLQQDLVLNAMER